MAIKTTYTSARANLAKLLDEVTDHNEVVIIQRRGAEDVALISAAELSGLLETAHLLRSPKNAERLLTALQEARTQPAEPESLEETLASSRTARAVAAVMEMQRQSVERGTDSITSEAIDAEISAVRQARRPARFQQ